jgi:CBS domain-containing protein
MTQDPLDRSAKVGSEQCLLNCVAEVMTKEVVCVEPGYAAQQALLEMSDKRISCLVISEGDTPVGILTERDMVGFSANLKGTLGDDLSVGELMTSPVVTASASDSVEDVIEMAHRLRIRHVPIVDGSGALVGIVSQSDFLRACAERHLGHGETEPTG